MSIFGENLRSLRSRLFHFNSVRDKNAGKHVTHYLKKNSLWPMVLGQHPP